MHEEEDHPYYHKTLKSLESRELDAVNNHATKNRDVSKNTDKPVNDSPAGWKRLKVGA